MITADRCIDQLHRFCVFAPHIRRLPAGSDPRRINIAHSTPRTERIVLTGPVREQPFFVLPDQGSTDANFAGVTGSSKTLAGPVSSMRDGTELR